MDATLEYFMGWLFYNSVYFLNISSNTNYAVFL